MVHMDDHIVDRNRRYDTGYESWYEYYALQWEIEALRENLFSKLRWSDEITLKFYNCDVDERVTKTIYILPECVIIVEGIFLQRPEWREFLDFCIYLDCPRETRFARESADAQTKLDKFSQRYWKAEDYYLETVRPMERADFVIPT